MKPFFSIVIVNFNGEKYIEDAIQSIINQSCNDWELIVVDGGSSDNSIDIINKYSDKYAWYVSEPDHGQSDAFNKGFSHASGKFYTWLNADDILMPGTLERVKQYLLNHEKQKWIALNTIYFNSKGKILSCSRGLSHSNFILKHGVLTEVAPSTIFSSDIYNESNKFDVAAHYVMDTDLWIKFAKLGYSYKRLGIFGWGFRMHEASKTAESIMDNKSTPKQVLEYNRMLRINNVQQYSWVLLLQKFGRIFYSKPISLLYSYYYKGKDISSI